MSYLSKRGHIARVYQSRPQNKKAQTTSNSQPVNNITEISLDSEYQLFVVHTHSNKPLKTTLLVEGQGLTVEIDTGAGVSLVSEETVNSSVMKKLPLQPTDMRLRTLHNHSSARKANGFSSQRRGKHDRTTPSSQGRRYYPPG